MSAMGCAKCTDLPENLKPQIQQVKMLVPEPERVCEFMLLIPHVLCRPEGAALKVVSV